MRAGEIKVEWVNCSVNARVFIIRYYKYLEHGHRTSECKMQDAKPQACFNCGQTGHRVKECSNESYCIKCCKGGHRVDKIRCPHFKSLVTEIREIRIGVRSRRVSVASVTSAT